MSTFLLNCAFSRKKLSTLTVKMKWGSSVPAAKTEAVLLDCWIVDFVNLLNCSIVVWLRYATDTPPPKKSSIETIRISFIFWSASRRILFFILFPTFNYTNNIRSLPT